jgi:hypothetical protein
MTSSPGTSATGSPTSTARSVRNASLKRAVYSSHEMDSTCRDEDS